MTYRHPARRSVHLSASRRLSGLAAVSLALVLTGCGAGADPGADPGAAASQDVVETAPGSDPATTASTSEPAVPEESMSPSTAAGSASASASPESEEETAEIVITITDFDYDMPDSVPPGATITVVNDDAVAHTVTSSPAGDFDLNVAAGETGTFTAPDGTGEYGMICIFHGNMNATLVVA